jgi:hypothetical protein
MHSLALCALSAQARWVLLEEKSSQVLALKASIAWSDENSRSLSDSLREQLEILLRDENISLEQVRRLYVFTGPGAFTGLRMALSFALGLARSLKIPLHGIPTYSLFEQSVWIPTRHQLARTLSFEECLQSGMEFLEVYSDSQSRLSVPPNPQQTLGIKNNPYWPTPEQILHAVSKASARLDDNAKIEIQYGLNPKISGQRHPI